MIKEKVVLIGPMGVGKSTLGKRAADLLGWNYQDNDLDMAQATGISIEDLSKMSVKELHKLEAEYILKVIASDAPFIAGAAASVIENQDVQAALQGINAIYLYIPLEQIYSRTGAGTVGRQAINPESDIIKERFERRDPLYRKYAHHVLNLSENPKRDTDRLIALIK
jgi:shikimate kinase